MTKVDLPQLTIKDKCTYFKNFKYRNCGTNQPTNQMLISVASHCGNYPYCPEGRDGQI